MTSVVFFLGFIGEVYKGQLNAKKKENEQRNYQHFQSHAIEHEYEQDYIHVCEHQTRQIRYPGDQLYKFGKNFCIKKFHYTTVNMIKDLDIRKTSEQMEEGKEEKEEVEKY